MAHKSCFCKYTNGEKPISLVLSRREGIQKTYEKCIVKTISGSSRCLLWKYHHGCALSYQMSCHEERQKKTWRILRLLSRKESSSRKHATGGVTMVWVGSGCRMKGPHCELFITSSFQKAFADRWSSATGTITRNRGCAQDFRYYPPSDHNLMSFPFLGLARIF